MEMAAGIASAHVLAQGDNRTVCMWVCMCVLAAQGTLALVHCLAHVRRLQFIGEERHLAHTFTYPQAQVAVLRVPDCSLSYFQVQAASVPDGSVGRNCDWILNFITLVVQRWFSNMHGL